MYTKLPYTLHTRHRSIAIAWTVILMPPTLLNITLFYTLWYHTNLDRILVLTLPTAILGIFTILALFQRIYLLTLPLPTYRPLSSPRYSLDIFQHGYIASLILISLLISLTLARGDSDNDGHELQIRLLSLPASLLMFFLATLTLLSLVLNGLTIKLPFRMDSVPKGNIIRPSVFYIVEDVVAVDGDGGIVFREAWNKRYNESRIFRKMIMEISVVWMVAFYVFSIGFTMVCFWAPVKLVYGIGWAGPFPLGGLMAAWTVLYVRARLGDEETEEGMEEGEGSGSGRVDESTALLGDERA